MFFSALILSTLVRGAAPPVIYPPIPPGLGAPLSVRDAGAATLPAELSAHVHESFYPTLSVRLSTDDGRRLSDPLRARLESYRATKTALQTELRARIDLLRETDVTRLHGATSALTSHHQFLTVYSRPTQSERA